LALTEEGREVTRRAIDVVQGLLHQLMEPFGGLDSARAREFTRELTTLLDVPLDPAVADASLSVHPSLPDSPFTEPPLPSEHTEEQS
jgi:hypothetical protein